MKNFLAVIGGIVVGFFLLLVIVFVSNMINTPGSMDLIRGSTPTQATQRSRTATEVSDIIIGSMEKTMPGEFRAEFDRENDLFKADMWNSFTREMIETMRSGIGLDRWDDINRDLIDLCNDMQFRFDDNGHPEVTVVLSLVDPDDPDFVFATAARGVVGFDYVRGIDLMNNPEG